MKARPPALIWVCVEEVSGCFCLWFAPKVGMYEWCPSQHRAGLGAPSILCLHHPAVLVLGLELTLHQKGMFHITRMVLARLLKLVDVALLGNDQRSEQLLSCVSIR